MNHAIIGVSIALVSLLCGCASVKGTQEKGNALAAKRLGADFVATPNSEQRYILYVKEEKPRQGTQPLSFFVYSMRADSVIYERTLESGTVRWHNATTLAITRIPGNITGDETSEQFTELYDLSTARILPK
ncbi:MAG: hypothetical protein HY961_06130 [Ignavibacteriae bacterium]|nr:hypothetical protein [Ignavibacteriota bacterium]